MTNAKNKNKKIPAWAWAVSGLLVGVVFAWIAVEAITASGQPANSGQSASGGQSVAQTSPTGGAAPQASANSAANEQLSAQLAQEQAAYARLESANNTVTNEAVVNNEVAQMMGMMGKTLSDYYGEVRNAQDISQTSGCLWGSQCETDFWAAFADQALGENSLNSTSFDQQAEAKYHSITGSYTYTDAKKQLDELVFAPYGAGVQSSDSDAMKIYKILNFITSHIHYEYDMSETPQAPAETLEQKSGDCKDFSILASAAFADAGITSAIMRMQNASGTAGHAMVLIQSSEALPFDYYSNLTQYGLPSGKWWVIDPQFTYAGQSENPSWFNQWGIAKAAMVGQGQAGSVPAPVQQAQSQGGSSDNQRVADAANIEGALELYFNAKGAYPTGVSNWNDLVNAIVTATGIKRATMTNSLPQGITYGYASDGTKFVLGVELENTDFASMQLSPTTMPSGFNWMIVPEGGQNGTTCGTDGLYCIVAW